MKSGSRSGREGRVHAIGGGEIRRHRARVIGVAALHCGEPEMRFVLCPEVRHAWACLNAMRSVETDVLVAVVVGDGAAVDVAHVQVRDVHDGAIVEKISPVPVAANEAASGVSEAVVDTAVEADVARPVTVVPYVTGTALIPIPW